MQLTTEQITALAPDPASAKAGRGLVNPGKWPTLGLSEEALWGECQGSGKDPYQVSVDLTAQAFKCSCPSRKFPCKHGLGLMYLAAEKAGSFTKGEPPAWTAEWLASRRDKAEKKAVAATEPPKAADPEAAAKRAAKRLARMKEGGEELSRWIADQVRSGIATLPQQPASTFRTVAARMVDAQAPGLGVEISRLEAQLHTGPEWPRRTLGQLGRMHLIAEGLSRFEALPEPLQADLRTTLGWPLDREEFSQTQPPVPGPWNVLGQIYIERERLWERRTWLGHRQTGQPALVLDFSHGNRNFPIPLIPGTTIEAELIYYPSASPMRALLAAAPARTTPMNAAFSASPSISAALENFAESLAANPWVHQAPLAVDDVIPTKIGENWWLGDSEGARIPLRMQDLDAWVLLAISGGEPVRVFGAWAGGELELLSAWAGGRFQTFNPPLS